MVDSSGRRAVTALRDQAVWTAVEDLAVREQQRLGRPLRVLDLGGGTGGLAVPLAQLGHQVTVVDPSPDALASLERRAAEFGTAERITAVQGDADSLDEALRQRPAQVGEVRGFDLVCCHGVLEVVDDPVAALAQVAAALTPDGHVSVLVAGRLAVVLSKALAGDLDAARAALTGPDGRWGRGDPLPRRYDAGQLSDLLERSGFATVHVHGVRIFTDLVPSISLETAADRQALADLERDAETHPGYADLLGALGAGLHAIAARR